MGKSKEQASAPLPDQKPSKTNGTQKISTAQRIFEIFELQRAAVQLQCASTSSTSHFRCHFVTLSLSLSFACSQDSQAAEVIDRVSRRSVCLPRVLRKIHSADT